MTCRGIPRASLYDFELLVCSTRDLGRSDSVNTYRIGLGGQEAMAILATSRYWTVCAGESMLTLTDSSLDRGSNDGEVKY